MIIQSRFRIALNMIAILILMALPQMGYAAEAEFLPSLDPGKIGRALDQQVKTLFRAPPAVDNNQLQSKLPQPKAQGAAGISFELTKIYVVGSTVYKNKDLESLVKPYLAKAVTLNDLHRMVEGITAKYRTDGYLLSSAIIPPQQITKGAVTVRIVEGSVGQVTIQGDPGRARKILEDYGDQIIQEHPLKVSTLEHYALLCNDIAGVEMKTVLTPSPVTPGSSDLTFVITKQSSYNAFAAVDNRGTYYLGPNEFFVGGNVNSMLRSGDRTSIVMSQASQVQELQFFQLNYLLPISNNGATFELNVQNVSNQPGYTLKKLNIVGRSQQVSVKVNYPLIRSRAHNLFLTTAFNVVNSYSDILGTVLYRDKIRSLELKANYYGIDRWSGSNNIIASVNQGINILGASTANSRQASRPKVSPGFTRLNLEATRIQPIYKQLSAFVGLKGQYAFADLYSSEEFGYGGSAYGRAFDSYEIAGDKGLAAKAELRYDHKLNKKYLQNIQYYTFYDIGAVWNFDTSAQLAKDNASSAGVGARLVFTKEVRGSVEMAKPLTHKVASQAPNWYRSRIFFNLSWMM